MPSSALAVGGASIAAAPVVVFGQQNFGNTVTDQGQSTVPDCDTTRGPGQSWWALPVTVGDHVTIDLAGQTQGDGFLIQVYPVGTNDFNVAPNAVYASTVNDQKDNEELVFSAPATGTMPMDVESCDATGTYNFTAHVRHRIVLSLPGISSLGRHGALSVSVHNPAGEAVSDPALMVALQVKRSGGWTTIGTAAVANSIADVSYRMPRALKPGLVKLRAVASGSAYLRQTSATVSTRLT